MTRRNIRAYSRDISQGGMQRVNAYLHKSKHLGVTFTFINNMRNYSSIHWFKVQVA